MAEKVKETKKVAVKSEKKAIKVVKKDVKVTKAEKSVKAEVKTASAKASTKLKFGEAKNADRFAVIAIAGSQLKVVEGLKYDVKKLDGVKGDKVEITDVLLVADGADVKIGTPNVAGAKVSLVIDSQYKGEKVVSFRFKAKSRFRKTHGSRELLTRVLVKKIEG